MDNKCKHWIFLPLTYFVKNQPEYSGFLRIVMYMQVKWIIEKEKKNVADLVYPLVVNWMQADLNVSQQSKRGGV